MKTNPLIPFSLVASFFVGISLVPRANAETIPTFIYTASAAKYGIDLVQIYPKHDRPASGPCIAKLGDTIELRVDRLVDWLIELKQKNLISSSKDGDDLVNEQVPKLCLFINGQPMRTLQASGWLKDNPDWPGHERMSQEDKNTTRHWIRFPLTRDPSNKQNRDDWDEVLRTPGFTPQMALTIGFYHPEQNTAEAVESEIRVNQSDPAKQFEFRRLAWDLWTAVGITVLGLSLVLFTGLVFLGGMIREPTLPVREDGLPPVSLGRCQMAFWFFLVASAFIFLWLITGRGDLDTINPTVLGLIGISAGTALGAAFITSNTADPEAAAKAPPHNYPLEIVAAEEKLEQSRDEVERTNSKMEIAQLKKKLRDYRRKHWNQWLLDLLSEEDDTSKRQIMSFHRFQIIVWTLVLGVIFCSNVITKLAMPNFDPTLLVLMGISSGTYLGFKFPVANKA